ncbi:MAG: hypothetical protein QMD12_00100 [Candidatus Aenigmarchaeota archaeon]|nr:hypothetical protein [Candidatus Aenigmarchaeota archaeon]
MKFAMKKYWLVPIVFLVIILVLFFLPSYLVPEGVKQKTTELCIQKCIAVINATEIADWQRGPCLLNPIPEYPDWVCDVAHSPREAIDNQPENQCSAYREGIANHFVEVDLGCKLIRAV